MKRFGMDYTPKLEETTFELFTIVSTTAFWQVHGKFHCQVAPQFQIE